MSTTTPAAPAALQTEFSFELPIGYEDDEGRVHRSGAMRLARARDEIVPLRDPRVRDNEAYLTVLLLARTITQALARSRRADTERVLAGYPHALSQEYGGYYTLGRVFVKLIGKPGLMRFATKHGMSRPALMRFALKLLANLTDPGGDVSDRLVNGLSRLAPNPE